jgi:hypothetical protein
MKMLALIVLLAACGGATTSTPAANPASPRPAAPSTTPVADSRCAAPQVWMKPGCGFHDAYQEGCQTRCDDGASACGAGTTCQKVDFWPDAGVAEVCGEEVHLCLPAS